MDESLSFLTHIYKLLVVQSLRLQQGDTQSVLFWKEGSIASVSLSEGLFLLTEYPSYFIPADDITELLIENQPGLIQYIQEHEDLSSLYSSLKYLYKPVV